MVKRFVLSDCIWLLVVTAANLYCLTVSGCWPLQLQICIVWLYLAVGRYSCKFVLSDCIWLLVVTAANLYCLTVSGCWSVQLQIKFTAVSSINEYLSGRNFLSSNEDECGNYFRPTSIADIINLLTPNDDYSGRTEALTSKRCILYIYSTNIVLNILNTVYTLRFFLFKMQFVS